jgi:tripartite-type tricarboxylate transporter receptor subunit TctC
MRLLSRVAVVLALLLVAWPAGAESWPTKPVRMVVPYPPGGPADALARVFANKLAEIWGQPVIVDNRGGAAGNIGTQIVAKAPADGGTFLLHSSSQVINGVLYRQPGYDPIADFTPISEIAYYMLVIVAHPSFEIHSLAELVDAAKAKPGEITYASAGGAGAPTHLAVELFKRAAEIDLLHVPYSGAGPATAALLGGQVMMMFNNPLSALPQIRAGKLRGIAVTGATRLALAPELPTVAESGYPGFEVGTWYGVWAPAGLPPEIAAAANAGIVKVLHMPEVREQLANQGLDALGTSAEDLAKLSRAELARWSDVIKAAHIVVD